MPILIVPLNAVIATCSASAAALHAFWDAKPVFSASLALLIAVSKVFFATLVVNRTPSVTALAALSVIRIFSLSVAATFSSVVVLLNTALAAVSAAVSSVLSSGCTVTHAFAVSVPL